MKKMIISSTTLKQALKKLSQAINNKVPLPALKNLYLKVYEREVQLITSDMELTILYTLPCESSHVFEMLIPFEFLKKVVDLSGDQPLSIELNGKSGKITGANDTYDIGSLDKVKDYPNLPEIPKDNFVSLNGTFIEWLGKAQATCGKDEQRPALLKICLDIEAAKVQMASTDASMIFSHSFPVTAKGKDQLLISPKIAKAMEGFASTEIYWHKQHIAFKSGNIEIVATRSEDKYPDYKVFFPNGEPNLSLNREALIKALQRACLSTDGTKHTILFLKREPGTIHFEATDENLNRKIQVDIPGSYKGSMEKVAVHAEKLLTLMEQVDYEEVRFHLHEVGKPIQITAESDADYKALIVPLTVNE